MPDDTLQGQGPSSAVTGVVHWYSPTDLRALPSQALPSAVARSDAPDSRESLLLGAPLLEAPELARRASSGTYVHRGAPPFHIAHGARDRFIPAAHSRQLNDALQAVGVDVEFAIIPNTDHRWIGAPDPEAIFTAAVDFVHRVTQA